MKDMKKIFDKLEDFYKSEEGKKHIKNSESAKEYDEFHDLIEAEIFPIIMKYSEHPSSLFSCLGSWFVKIAVAGNVPKEVLLEAFKRMYDNYKAHLLDEGF